MQFKVSDEKVRELYLQLMEGKITNTEFEELTGAIPTKDNPSRKDWEERNNK